MLMSFVQPMVKPFLKISSVPSSEQLAPYLRQKNAYVGIEFPDSYANITELPDDLTYSLRYPGELRRTGNALNPLFFNWRTDFLFPLFQPGGARNHANDHDGTPSGYYLEGFLFMQQFIFRAFMQMKNSLNLDLDLVPKILVRVSFLIVNKIFLIS
jgi:ATP-binding cassette subfamily A (ABC1) protein 3